MEIFTVALLAGLAVIGLMNNMMWIAIPSFIIFLAYIQGVRSGDKEPAAPSGKPIIRPIIVQREYAGPSSIYPAKMRMRVNPGWDTRKWWERALGYAGQFTRTSMYASGMVKAPRAGWRW